MTTAIHIRTAAGPDAAPIAEIYNQAISERNATLEVEFRSPEERRSWLKNRDLRHPVFVAESTEGIVGWGSLNPFNPREAYRFVADISLDVDRAHRKQGVGQHLLQQLHTAATDLGYRKLVISALPWNRASIELFRRHGFRKVGVFYDQGQLDGQWVNTIVMELLLNCDHRRTDENTSH